MELLTPNARPVYECALYPLAPARAGHLKEPLHAPNAIGARHTYSANLSANRHEPQNDRHAASDPGSVQTDHVPPALTPPAATPRDPGGVDRGHMTLRATGSETAYRWPSAPDVVPETQCQFTLSAPRHFVYPALLLLLTEQPRHGYALVDELQSLGLGKIDRPSIYRALSDLERDGLVHSWDAPPLAGSTRHVYEISPDGVQALEAWMSIVAQERASLDLVLKRYWYCNAQRISEVSNVDELADIRTRSAASHIADGFESGPLRFTIASDRSSLVVEARSNIGPIAFNASGLTGYIDAELKGGLVSDHPAPTAHIEVRVSDLKSGNTFYDAELLRRIDARRHPTVTLNLLSATRLGEGNCYQIAGDVNIHGVSQQLSGSVTATAGIGSKRQIGSEQFVDRRLTIVGEDVLDIRLFGMDVPAIRILKIYPEVRLRLHIEADAIN
jgi:PadR family transcriptional regulator PadR